MTSVNRNLDITQPCLKYAHELRVKQYPCKQILRPKVACESLMGIPY